MEKVYLIGTCVEESSIWTYANFLLEEFSKCKDYKIVDKRYIYQSNLWKIKYIRRYLKYLISLSKLNDWIVLELSWWNIIPSFLLKRSQKTVHIVHDLFYYNHKNWFSPMMDFYYCYIHKFLYKITLDKATKIIAISEATKLSIQQHFKWIDDSKITIIHNGVDINKFTPSKIYNIEKPYLLYVWSEAERKNLKWIIEAFWEIHKEFPNLKLIKAPIENNKVCREKTLSYIKAQKLKIWEDIKFVDKYLSLDDLIILYQQATIFLFPSFEEGFWFPIIEAQACGIPVVTSNIPPMSSLVKYKDMLVDPYNSSEIANALRKILSNKSLAIKMRNIWIKNAQSYSRQDTAKKFIDVFKEII